MINIFRVVLFCAISVTAATGRADLIFDLSEVGSDVVLTASGTVDLTDSSIIENSGMNATVNPHRRILAGPSALTDVDLHAFDDSDGPSSLGANAFVFASSGSGGPVGIEYGNGYLLLPEGYVSGAALSATSLFSGHTLTSLGITAGTYDWTFGNNNIQLNANEAASIPEPSAFGLLLIASVAGWTGRRKLSAPVE